MLLLYNDRFNLKEEIKLIKIALEFKNVINQNLFKGEARENKISNYINKGDNGEKNITGL